MFGDNSDKALFAMLEKYEGDTHRMHRVSFTLAFAARKKAEHALNEILALGLPGVVVPFGRCWRIVTSKTMSVRLSSLTGMRLVFEDIAWRTGGTYVGWETEILRSEEAGERT